MTRRLSAVLFWLLASATAAAIVAVAYRIATTPDAPYPVTSALLAVILLGGLLYLALHEYLTRDPDAEYQRRVLRDMARNVDHQGE